MEAFVEWITANEIPLTIIISALSFLMTTILTVIIIIQTGKLSKKQAEQELHISNQQEELQKKQIRLDTFEHKNEIYKSLYKVLQLSGELYVLCEKFNLSQKDTDTLNKLLKSYIEHIGIDVIESLWLFKQAEYIFPENIYKSIKVVSDNFDILTGDITTLEVLPQILTKEEIEEHKKTVLKDIQERIDNINDQVSFIESIMPKELCIHNLYQ